MTYQAQGQVSRAGRMSAELTRRIVEPIRIRERNKKILIYGGLATAALGGLYFVITRRKKR